jgi:uncharacterized cupin superfamily protein
MTSSNAIHGPAIVATCGAAQRSVVIDVDPMTIRGRTRRLRHPWCGRQPRRATKGGDMTAARATSILARDAPPRAIRSNYPEPYASRMDRRTKRPLGDLFGLQNFGVNLTTLAPGGVSGLKHRHDVQDEFVYVVEGRPTLVVGDVETELQPGMCAGFAKQGEAHVLVNRTSDPCTYLEIGDRTRGDRAEYPDDDIKAELGPDGKWLFTHKDGRPYA